MRAMLLGEEASGQKAIVFSDATLEAVGLVLR